MFGYIVANSKILTKAEEERYRAVYCGLCRALKKRHGSIGRLTLTYDMTFLVLVLSSLYEPDESCGSKRCLVHPFKCRCYTESDITGYAADMNVALAYLNQIDNWCDDKNLLSLMAAKRLKKKYIMVAAAYPRQCATMVDCLNELSDMEKAYIQDPDTCAKIFGRLLGEIFALYEGDRWSAALRKMGSQLGEFIYIMDAVIDLEKDIRHKRFNPLKKYWDLGQGYDYFHNILTMLIGECCINFDTLPLVKDVSIMRNILCSGVWMKYELFKSKKIKGEKSR